MDRKKVVKVRECKPKKCDVSDGTNLQCSVCVYQNYPCMGRFCELGVKLWLEWNKWKPKVGETYYVPKLDDYEADYIDIIWSDFPWDEVRYNAGFVCRTKEEALELAEKMLTVAKERMKND